MSSTVISPRNLNSSQRFLASSPKTTLKDCDPEKNFLLKKHGLRGIIVAVAVVGSAFIIILVSKWNEIRLQKIPTVWRNRLKSMIKDSAGLLTSAKEASNIGNAMRHAIEAGAILLNAKKLAGPNDLAKISGLDIGKLEGEIESILRRNISNDLLVKNPEIENKRKENVREVPKAFEEKRSVAQAAENFRKRIET